MPQTSEVNIEWIEYFAYWPVRSTWSQKRVWWKKYWKGEIYIDVMGRPPIKQRSWKLIYTQNEYLLMLLRQDEKYYNRPV